MHEYCSSAFAHLRLCSYPSGLVEFECQQTTSPMPGFVAEHRGPVLSFSLCVTQGTKKRRRVIMFFLQCQDRSRLARFPRAVCAVLASRELCAATAAQSLVACKPKVCSSPLFSYPRLVAHNYSNATQHAHRNAATTTWSSWCTRSRSKSTSRTWPGAWLGASTSLRECLLLLLLYVSSQCIVVAR